MLRSNAFPCAVFACGVLTSTAGWAGYDVEHNDFSGSANLGAGAATVSTRGVNFGAGRVDLRDGSQDGKRIDWQEYYLKPGFTLNYSLAPDLQLISGASLIWAHTSGDGDAGGYSRGGDGRTAWEEAYVGAKAGNWTLTGGRQNYLIGTGFIVGDGNLDMFRDGDFWLAPRTAFRDSALLGYSAGALQAQAFSLRTDDDLGDFRLNGANLDYRLDDRVTLGLTAMGVQSLASRAEQLTPRDGMRVYNLRALDAKLPGIDDLTLHGEYAIQRGSGDGVDYAGHAWYAQADYRFSTLPLTPQLGYRYAVFSGDDDLGDHRQKAWDPLAKGYVDWSTWLIGDVVGNYLLFNSNERVSQWSLKAHLSDNVTLGGIHYQFYLDEKNFQGIAVSDRRFADESVVFLDWNPQPNLHTSLAFNWVDPKAAAKQALGDEAFTALELYFTYQY